MICASSPLHCSHSLSLTHTHTHIFSLFSLSPPSLPRLPSALPIMQKIRYNSIAHNCHKKKYHNSYYVVRFWVCLTYTYSFSWSLKRFWSLGNAVNISPYLCACSATYVYQKSTGFVASFSTNLLLVDSFAYVAKVRRPKHYRSIAFLEYQLLRNVAMDILPLEKILGVCLSVHTMYCDGTGVPGVL